ncbi:MAG: hypothetical protein ACHP84_10345 [Caulobacterales bacterium]|jgi:hypothetical protein
MARQDLAGLGMTGLIAALILGCGAARACPGVGVITRIEGLPQDVIITRIEDGKQAIVSRPRVLEVVCQGDLVHTAGATSIVISVDGQGLVRVNREMDYRVPARSGAPSLAGNAYRTISDQVMPDMKRLPWNVRVKGAGDDFGFALSALSAGGQKLHAGQRSLLVRLVGGTPPYRVEIRSDSGGVVATQSSSGHDVVLPGVPLNVGAYIIKVADAAPSELSAQIAVVDSGPPSDQTYSGLADPEIRAAATATALARTSPGTWSFEAEQLIDAAPELGLDRDKVYELIESYSAE